MEINTPSCRPDGGVKDQFLVPSGAVRSTLIIIVVTSGLAVDTAAAEIAEGTLRGPPVLGAESATGSSRRKTLMCLEQQEIPFGGEKHLADLGPWMVRAGIQNQGPLKLSSLPSTY